MYDIYYYIMHKDNLRKLIRIFLEGGIGTPRNMSLAARHSAKYRHNPNYPFHKKYPKMSEGNSEELNEINPEEVTIPKEFIHKELNPKIWDINKSLKPEVRNKLLQNVKEFYDFLNIKIPIKGIKLVGSNANYNWSSKSDIDVHLFFDFNELDSDYDFVQNFFLTKKNLWNTNHNVTIKGLPVEIYCNSLEDEVHSSGVYDLWNQKWISEPSIEEFSIDKIALQVKTASIINAIEDLEKNQKISNEDRLKQAINLRDRIKEMRQSGLEKGGEFSIENLSFKYLRNNNYLERLHTIKQKSLDTKLSLK